MLEHERGRDAIAPTEIEIALGAPTRFEEHLTRLVKERLGHVELAGPVIAVRLVARSVQEAAAPSDSLFPEPGSTPQDHAWLLELLSARLGAENVLVPAPHWIYKERPTASDDSESRFFLHGLFG